MPARRPYVNVGGDIAVLPPGDTVDGAATTAGSMEAAFDSGAGPTLGTTEATVGTVVVNVPTATSKVDIVARVNLLKDAGTTVRTATVRVRRGSTNGDPQVGRESNLRSQGVATSDFGPGVVVAHDVPGVTGNVTYTVRALTSAANAATTPHFEISAVVLEGAVGPQGPAGADGAPGANGTGDVAGPASAVADRIAVYNGTTGKIIKDGGSTIANVLARANHTGTQIASTISDFASTVLATVLTGLSTATSTAVTAADTILVAIGKLQAQVTLRALTTTTINTTAPLAGGGDLSTNRTLTISAATTGAAGSMSAADKTRLDGMATGATANATDAQLRDRTTHTGVQAQSTVTNLVADLAAKASLNAAATFNDITATRGDGSGYTFFGGGARYVGYDGSAYVMPGAALWVNNAPVWTSATFDPALKANLASPTFSGTVTLPSHTGTLLFAAGTGDGASYTTYNTKINAWWGLGFAAFDGVVRGFYDARTGTWDVKGGYRVDGTLVYYAGMGDLLHGGRLRSYGATAALQTDDRTTGSVWTWYATGGVYRLDQSTVGEMLAVSSAGWWTFNTGPVEVVGYFRTRGSLSGIQHQDRSDTGQHWTEYAAGGAFRLYSSNNYDVNHWTADGNFHRKNANSTTMTRQPRIFVQASDPGAAAEDGDIWMW